MGSREFELYLDRISYEGDNIGSDLTVTVRPGAYPARSIKPSVLDAGRQKPLTVGKATNQPRELLVKDQSQAGTVTIPVAVKIEEKDKISDEATETKNLVINLNRADAQAFDMRVTVQGKGGDQGKTARFNLNFSADVIGDPRPFRIGIDNIGFENPEGAVRISGMRGNCYTMAVVAKLFYQAAEFRLALSPGETAGFDPNEIAQALRAQNFPATKFTVRGYPSLFAMSDKRNIKNGQDPESWMEQASRFQVGLAPRAPQGPVPANADALVKLYQMITTIHYLHYLQNQAAPLIGTVLGQLQVGGKGIARIAADTVARLKTGLPQGDLGIVCMFNPDPKVLFGHVVLAYKIVEPVGQPYTDIYVYDNAEFYTKTDSETVLRVDRASGKFDYMEKAKGADPQFKNPNGDRNPGASWWDPSQQVLILLPDSNLSREHRLELADKLQNGIAATAYIQATGDLIKSLTEQSPQTSTLFDNLKEFLLACQRINKKLRIEPPWKPRDLSANPSVEEINRYLADYTDPVVSSLFPFVLPKGLALSNTKLGFAGARRNEAWLETTVTIRPDTPILGVLDAVRASALFAKDERLAALVQNFARVFEKEKVTLNLKLSLTKTATPAPLQQKIGPFVALPNLEGSHCIIGDIAPGLYDPKEGDHRIEIGATILNGALQSLLKAQGAFAPKTFTYTGIDGVHTGNVTLNSSLLECLGELNLKNDVSGFLGVVFNLLSGAEQGVTFRSNPLVSARLAIAKAKGKNVFTAKASALALLKADDGLGGLVIDAFVKAARLAALAFLPTLATASSTAVTAQMSAFVKFANSTTISFGPPVLSSKDGSITLRIPLNSFAIDVGATMTTLFGQRVPAEVKDIQIGEGRLVLVTSNDG